MGVAETSVEMAEQGNDREQRAGGVKKCTVADINPYCMGETFLSVAPDGRFWKKMDDWKADEQIKFSKALDMGRKVQERSTFNESAIKMSGTVYFGSDTTGR